MMQPPLDPPDDERDQQLCEGCELPTPREELRDGVCKPCFEEDERVREELNDSPQ